MDLAKAFGRGDDAYNTAMSKKVQLENMFFDAGQKRNAAIARDAMVADLRQSGDPMDKRRALAIVSGVDPKYLGDVFSGATPNEVRTFQMMTDGLSAEDVMKARRINLGLDGRASSAALKYEWVTGPDGVPRWMAADPNVASAQQVMEQAWPSLPQPGQYSTPAGPVRVGPGLTPDQWELVQADVANDAQSNNYQLPERSDRPPSHGRFDWSRTGSPLTGRSKEAEARAVKGAELQTQIDYAPQVAQAEAEKTRAVETAKAKAERDTKQATKSHNAGELLRLIGEARRLLPTATGGGLAAARDKVGGFFGEATEGARMNAALKTIAGQMTAMQPRMEGPQSNIDVEMYKQMAGDVANEALPTPVRLAALDQIERLQKKYDNPNQDAASPDDARRRSLLDKY